MNSGGGGTACGQRERYTIRTYIKCTWERERQKEHYSIGNADFVCLFFFCLFVCVCATVKDASERLLAGRPLRSTIAVGVLKYFYRYCTTHRTVDHIIITIRDFKRFEKLP